METTPISVQEVKSTFAQVCKEVAPYYKINPNGSTELTRALRGSLKESERQLREQVKTVLIALVSGEPWAGSFKQDSVLWAQLQHVASSKELPLYSRSLLTEGPKISPISECMTIYPHLGQQNEFVVTYNYNDSDREVGYSRDVSRGPHWDEAIAAIDAHEQEHKMKAKQGQRKTRVEEIEIKLASLGLEMESSLDSIVSGVDSLVNIEDKDFVDPPNEEVELLALEWSILSGSKPQELTRSQIDYLSDQGYQLDEMGISTTPIDSYRP